MTAKPVLLNVSSEMCHKPERLIRGKADLRWQWPNTGVDLILAHFTGVPKIVKDVPFPIENAPCPPYAVWSDEQANC
jgi:hypothetical protein